VFPLLVFGFGLLGGAGIGGFMGSHVAPDTSLGVFLGAFGLPVGVLVGLSMAEKVDPIRALVDFVSILDRHASDSTRGFSLSGTEMMVALGPTAVSAILGFVLATFMKVDPFPVLTPLALTGLGYGVAMAILIAYLASTTGDE
jgi:hypothetical protein